MIFHLYVLNSMYDLCADSHADLFDTSLHCAGAVYFLYLSHKCLIMALFLLSFIVGTNKILI